MALLVFYPFFFAIWISFTDQTVGAEGQFVGLANYLVSDPAAELPRDDPQHVRAGRVVQSLKLVSGLGIAVLLNQPIRGRQPLARLVLLPWAMPAFVAFITWKLLYAPQGGAFNLILLGSGSSTATSTS